MQRKSNAAIPFLILSLFFVGTTKQANPAESNVSAVWSVQFSPDGNYLAVGRYQWVQLWDLGTREVIQDLEPILMP